MEFKWKKFQCMGGGGENVYMSQCLVYLYQLVLRRVALQGRNT